MYIIQRMLFSMRQRNKLILTGVVASVLLFLFFAPVVYTPGNLNDASSLCNFSCLTSLYLPSHQSISAHYFGIGVTQWESWHSYCIAYPWVGDYCT